MSDYLSAQVWFSDLCPTLKPLAATLANIAGDDGEDIYPTVEYLSWRIGAGESTIRRGMSRLRDMGILLTVSVGGGRGKPTEYRMDADALPKRPRWKHKPSDIERVSDIKPSQLQQKPSHLGGQNPLKNDRKTNSILIEEKQTIKKEREEEAIVPISLWLAFAEMRQKMGRPLTDRAGEMIRRDLRKFRDQGHDPITILEQSIMNSWAGVFPPKESRSYASAQERRSQNSANAIDSVLGRFAETSGNFHRALPPADK